jgi:hypothetical protein
MAACKVRAALPEARSCFVTRIHELPAHNTGKLMGADNDAVGVAARWVCDFQGVRVKDASKTRYWESTVINQ